MFPSIFVAGNQVQAGENCLDPADSFHVETEILNQVMDVPHAIDIIE